MKKKNYRGMEEENSLNICKVPSPALNNRNSTTQRFKSGERLAQQ